MATAPEELFSKNRIPPTGKNRRFSRRVGSRLSHLGPRSREHLHPSGPRRVSHPVMLYSIEKTPP